MMQQEFETIIDQAIGAEDYAKIETVYMWYPGIETHQDIANLYKIGMVLVNDLLPRALEIREIDTKITNLKIAREKLQEGVK